MRKFLCFCGLHKWIPVYVKRPETRTNAQAPFVLECKHCDALRPV